LNNFYDSSSKAITQNYDVRLLGVGWS